MLLGRRNHRDTRRQSNSPHLAPWRLDGYPKKLEANSRQRSHALVRQFHWNPTQPGIEAEQGSGLVPRSEPFCRLSKRLQQNEGDHKRDHNPLRADMPPFLHWLIPCGHNSNGQQSVQQLKDPCCAHAAAYAHGHHAVADVAAFHFCEQRGGEFSPCAAQRMAEGDGASVHVDLFRIEA